MLEVEDAVVVKTVTETVIVKTREWKKPWRWPWEELIVMVTVERGPSSRDGGDDGHWNDEVELVAMEVIVTFKISYNGDYIWHFTPPNGIGDDDPCLTKCK